MKTLAVRVRHQNASALKVARFLAAHPQVASVHYPGLESHPDYTRAVELFVGCGGTLSFELKGSLREAERFIASVRLPVSAPSLGGVETLITRPATTSHSGMSEQKREEMGIGDGLIRLSVGLEAPEDLIADFAEALK